MTELAMTNRINVVSLFALAVFSLLSFAGAADRPNIVFLIADDLGYGDVGAFGQTKIRTPSIDQIAKDGMRLTQCYAGNAVCAPSRCVLMTGMHPGHAQVRNNREVQPEGQHPLKAGTATLPRLFKEAGYVTGGFGNGAWAARTATAGRRSRESIVGSATTASEWPTATTRRTCGTTIKNSRSRIRRIQG